jgi:hypothetical protein
MSVGLDGPKSDMDVLFVGGTAQKLNDSWSSLSRPPDEVCDRLRNLVPKPSYFMDELVGRIKAHFNQLQIRDSKEYFLFFFVFTFCS